MAGGLGNCTEMLCYVAPTSKNKTGTNLKSPLKRKDEETIDHGHKEKKEQIWRTKGGDQNNKERKNESWINNKVMKEQDQRDSRELRFGVGWGGWWWCWRFWESDLTKETSNWRNRQGSPRKKCWEGRQIFVDGNFDCHKATKHKSKQKQMGEKNKYWCKK